MLGDLMQALDTCTRIDIGTESAWGLNAEAELVVFASGAVMAVRTNAHPTGAGWRVSRWDEPGDPRTPTFSISLPTGDVVRYVREVNDRLRAEPSTWPEPAGRA